MTTLQALFIMLDMVLTEKTYSVARHTARNQPVSAEWLMYGGNIYYLSDCGYSRVALNSLSDSFNLFLTSGSLEKAENNWKQHTELVAVVQTELHRELRAAEWME